MATVTVHADDELLAKANEALVGTDVTLDDAFARTLDELVHRKASLQQFEEMNARLRAEGARIPILTREERNAR